VGISRKDMKTAKLTDPLGDLADDMKLTGFSHLPILNDQDVLIGVFNEAAVFNFLWRETEQIVSRSMTHHPHVHMIVPGGGLSPDGTRWVACKPGFFLHVRVLSRLFRRLFIEGLLALHRARELVFFGDLAELSEPQAFAAYLAPLRKIEWVVYAKPPFGGPEAVLAYLSRYTHRVAISNSRLISADTNTIAFQWKDYRVKSGDRRSVMRLSTSEFIRRFLIHVLPDRFHRIRHYGLLASAQRKANIAKARTLLGAQTAKQDDPPVAEVTPLTLREPCPDCGGQMRIIETFQRGQKPHSRAPPRKAAA
jgi:hypothetical protein